MQLPKPLLQLIDELSSLPGVGRRSATRMAFHLLQADPQKTKSVGESLGTIHSKIKKCNLCNNFSASDICQICADGGRSQDQLLVVESALDLVAFAETDYRGLFFVLGGLISPLQGKGPDDIAVSGLLERVDQLQDSLEVVLALPTSLEGEATASFVAAQLEQRYAGVEVTRLARGLPTNSAIDYQDPQTLTNALLNRR